MAENNTKLFRQVFRCMPDNEVKNWRDYKAFAAYGERFAQSQGMGKDAGKKPNSKGATGPPGSSAAGLMGTKEMKAKENAKSWKEKLLRKHQNRQNDGKDGDDLNVKINEKNDENLDASPDPRIESCATNESSNIDEKVASAAAADDDALQTNRSKTDSSAEKYPDAPQQAAALPFHSRTVQYTDGAAPPLGITTSHPPNAPSSQAQAQAQQQQSRRRRGTTKSSAGRAFNIQDELLGKADAEELLGLVQGHLVVWPYNWLEREVENGNWLYSIDTLAPLEI